ncbi:MAG TPA: hypothetical protein VNE61_16485 [Ktedonobacteraceae bacterium]|nr:hypothetical protein [Ktedonobacteraceae bacterium]
MSRRRKLAVLALTVVLLVCLLIGADVMDSISRVQGSTSALLLLGACILGALVSLGLLFRLSRHHG